MVEKKKSALDVFPRERLIRNADQTFADQVFELIQAKILTLEIPPRTKLSETEVASLLGVSRQPVREAFKRLAKLEFLIIRPQSGTTVSLISEAAALRALYIRTALEVQSCRSLCACLDGQGRTNLADLLEQQKQAIDKKDGERFHALDDAFHKEICVLAGVGYVWDLIHETKPHMDRVRMISQNPESLDRALNDHRDILNALCHGCGDKAVVAMRAHLSRFSIHIENVKAENHNWFLERAQ